jgi:dihydropteroate synthase
MPEVCAEYDVAVSKMASPPDLERPGAIEDVDDIYEALHRNGLTEKTLVDPAFGGWSEEKTLDDDRETFRRLREFRAFDRPILVSINRKNFLREIAGRDTEGALPVSLAATSMAVERGAHVIRTHDVAETRDAALIGDRFARDRFRQLPGTGGVGIEELDVTTVAEAQRHVRRVTGDTVETPDEGAAVARSYLLTGLDQGAEAAIQSAAEESDVLVAGTADATIVAGPLSALRTTVDRLDDCPAAESALRDALAETR